MEADNVDRAQEVDIIEELLETFMQANAGEEARLLAQQGHLLLSDIAFQKIHEQIAELNSIIGTLNEKLHILEEARQQRELLRKAEQEQKAASGFAIQDLFQRLKVAPEPVFSMADKTEEVRQVLLNLPPEKLVHLMQQVTSQGSGNLFTEMQRTLNVPNEQIKDLQSTMARSSSLLTGDNLTLMKHLLEEAWKLPLEERKRFWSGEVELIGLEKIQAYAEQQHIDVSELNRQREQLMESLPPLQAHIPPEISIPFQEKNHESGPELQTFASLETAAPISEAIPPQITDRETLFAYLLEVMPRLMADGGNTPLPFAPEVLERFDSPSAPVPKQLKSLYRIVYLLQHSEGRRQPDLQAIQELFEELTTDSTFPEGFDSQSQMLIEQARNWWRLIVPGQQPRNELEIGEIIAAATTVLQTDPSKNAIARIMALVVRCQAYLERTGGMNQKDFEKALQDCDELIGLGASSQQAFFEAQGYMLRGFVLSYSPQAANARQRCQRALDDLERALLFFDRDRYPDQRAEIHLRRSLIYHQCSYGDLWQNYESALEESQAALSLLSRAEKPVKWAAAHQSCGEAYRLRFTRNPLQDAWEASRHYAEALQVFTPQEAPDDWASTRIAQARIERKLLETSTSSGSRELRPDFFNPGFSLAEALPTMRKGLLKISNDLTGVLAMITKERDPYNWADARYERAFTRALYPQGERKKHLQAVFEDFNAALEVFTLEQYPGKWADTQLKLAVILLRYTVESFTRDAQDALRFIDAALTVYTREETPFDYYWAQELRAFACERLGFWEEAAQALEEAREVERYLIATTRHGSDLHDLLATFTGPEIALRRAQAALHLEPPDYTRAVIELENGRVKTLQHARARPGQATLQTSLPTVEEIARCLSHPRAALVYLAAGANKTASVDVDQHFSLGIDEGLALILTIRSDGTPHIKHLSLPLLTNMALTFLLEPVFEDQKSEKQYRLEDPVLYRDGENTTRAKRGNDERIPINLEHAITRLGELGLNNVAQYLHENDLDEVTFIAYSSLGLFPLNAAQVKLTDGQTHYLGELFEVTFAPSALILAQARQQVAGAQAVTAVLSAGNPQPQVREFKPLPYAAQEAKLVCELARMYGYNPLYLPSKEITRTRLLDTLRSKPGDSLAGIYAHLAMHAVYQPTDPARSQLILAGSEDIAESERCIFLQELLDGAIDLSGIRLLVLSACQSSVIDIQQIPNEVVGLAATFLQAGVSGVVASLWKVKDMATYLLMTYFAQLYLCAHGKISPARALALAQRWLREEATYQVIINYDPLHLAPDDYRANQWRLADLQLQAQETPEALPFADPKYWAAFTLSGY